MSIMHIQYGSHAEYGVHIMCVLYYSMYRQLSY